MACGKPVLGRKGVTSHQISDNAVLPVALHWHAARTRVCVALTSSKAVWPESGSTKR